MPSTFTRPVSTETALTISLDSLASATYVAATAVDLTSINPEDVSIRVTAVTTGTAPSGNKRCNVFIQTSPDGSTFSSGPTSGTTTTDEPDLFKIGDLPCNSASATHRKVFSVFAALGFIPRHFKLIVQNDLGTALSTGCSAAYSTVTGYGT